MYSHKNIVNINICYECKAYYQLYVTHMDNCLADHFLSAIVARGSVFYMTFQYDMLVEWQISSRCLFSAFNKNYRNNEI